MAHEKILNRIVEYSFYALFFLVPLIFTPFNFELFEYNKMMLTYGLTVVIVGAWLSKMILQRRILIRRTPFDIPIVLFLASQILSTIFSIDRHTSLWGYYSRFHGGLLSSLAYLLLFYALVSNFDRKRVLNACYWLLSSAAIISVYGILEHFGHSLSCLLVEGKFEVSCWVQDVQNRVFATLGQPNWLAAWLVILIPLPMAFMLREKEVKNKKFIYHALLLFAFYLTLLYTKSRSGLAGLGTTWLAFWGVCAFCYRKKLKTLACPFIAIHLIILLVSALVGTPFTPSFGEIWQKFTKKAQAQTAASPQATPTVIPEVVLGGTESFDIRKIVWKGAIEIWRNYPIFGSGVETFAYSYYNFRPIEHNLVSEWDFLYNKAHNEYLNFAATTGTVGLLTHLLFIFWVIFSFLKSASKESPLVIGLLAGWVSIPVTNFFGFSVVPVALLFFLFPALAITLTSTSRGSNRIQPRRLIEDKYQHPVLIGLGVSTLIFLCLLFLLARFWYADTLYAKAEKFEKQGEYPEAFNFAQRAVLLNKNEPLYRDTLSYQAASLAETALLQKKEELAKRYAALAIDESSRALATSPRNLNFLKTRTKNYYKLASLDKNYLQEALLTLKQAAQLAPTDAKIFYNLGLVYLQLGQTQEAVRIFEKTVEMKRNYQVARYTLATLYESLGEKERALGHATYILTYINSSVPEVRELYKRLAGKEFGE